MSKDDLEPGQWTTPPRDSNEDPYSEERAQADREMNDRIDRKGWEMGLGSTD